MAITMYNNKEAGGKRIKVGKRLWLTKAGDRLVEDGDKAAYSLFCHAHHRVPEAQLEALGGIPGSTGEGKVSTKGSGKRGGKAKAASAGDGEENGGS